MQNNNKHFKTSLLSMACVCAIAVPHFAQAQQVEEFRLFGGRKATAQTQPAQTAPAQEEITSNNAGEEAKPQEFRLFGGNRAPAQLSPPPPPPPPPPRVRENNTNPTQEFHLFGAKPPIETPANTNPTNTNIDTPQPELVNSVAPNNDLPNPVSNEVAPMPQWQLPEIPQTQNAIETNSTPVLNIEPDSSLNQAVETTNNGSEPVEIPSAVSAPVESPKIDLPPPPEAAPILPRQNVETPSQPNQTIETNQAPPSFQPPVAVRDESEELLGIDRAMADNIFANGPFAGYGAVISAEGVLYDAGGASPIGQEAVSARFEGFPQGVVLERRPEKAMASSGAGATWGAYAIKREGTQLSEGRYVAIWRKEASGWKIVTELAAGRSIAPTALPPRPAAPRPATNNTIAPTATPPLRDALGRPVGATTRTQGTN